MRPFRFLPHSVTSDVAFEATGKTAEELFVNAAAATFSVMCDLTKVKPREERAINLKAETLEDLLFNFLSELIFLKDRDEMLFSKFTLNAHLSTAPYLSREGRARLSAKILGERIDPSRHKLGVDVKAVTKHNFGIVREKNMYKAIVVLDI